MGEITGLDYVLLPFYLLLIYVIAIRLRNKYYPENHPYRPYFITGLTAKVFGAIFIGLVYNYYYAGGDTFNFFFHSQIINSTFFEAPATWLRLITHHADQSNITDELALSQMYWYDDASAYAVSCLGALIGVFCFTQYLAINVVVACISFTGMWLMFVTFARQYPSLIKPIALAILFLPGPIVWGSGLFKDSFCMFGIGCIIYCVYVLFEERRFKFGLLMLLLFSIVLTGIIKAYIIIALLPILLFKTVLVYLKKLAQRPEKRGVFYTAVIVTALFGLVTLRRVAVYLPVSTIQETLETIKQQKDYLLRVSIEQEGSAYDLGDFDPTVGSLLRKFWPAVNVTLFRPYLWESRSAIQLFNSLESTGTLLLTVYLIFRRNIFKTIRNIFTDPNLILCLLFTLLFAFIVGVSTYNFGSLSRYKIPCTPFYILFLVILLFKDSLKDEAETQTESELPAGTEMLS